MRRAGTAAAKSLTTEDTGDTEAVRQNTMPFGLDIAEEDQKVIVRSNGTVGYVGKDIAYHMWKFGLLGAILATGSSFAIRMTATAGSQRPTAK